MIALDAPCKYGHTSGRSATTGKCLECRRGVSRRSYHKHGDKRRAADAVRRIRPDYKARKKNYKQWWDQNHSSLYASLTAEQRAAKASFWKNDPEMARIQRAGIQATYDFCECLTRMTNVLHHVDHVWPLRRDDVVGLHCCANLQILKADDNIRKSNKLPDEWQRLSELYMEHEATS